MGIPTHIVRDCHSKVLSTLNNGEIVTMDAVSGIDWVPLPGNAYDFAFGWIEGHLPVFFPFL
jgi:hypothetical protein